eukprot:CAMPEP_0197246650 /NCGR_PEP_ID=MMETSP1429-20130617/18778_1 /TAXON_ID=49237 /ORGANISM="Chaetoceros  sp., Strain UNC1202" /LENGTH=390 /DNA_ID=CAMNT_0042707367 /DNA_START=20 /DNA_END=1192 /DNA_ORIENTATION=+
MNTFQQKLYDDLMQLVKSSKKMTFYFVDREADGVQYRIFNYRLASSYSQFLQPGALECRGVMFEMDAGNKDNAARTAKPIRLAALPMPKFFNLNENPLTRNLDLSKTEDIMLKADGSLISTYIHIHDNDDGEPMHELCLKSKASVDSVQCKGAMEWLAQDENSSFREELFNLTSQGTTVNLEWCAPQNRVVLEYTKPTLSVLNMRDMVNGDFVKKPSSQHPEISNRFIEHVKTEDPVQFINTIKDQKGIEGYVVRLDDGQLVKIKTTWYLHLHHCKGKLNSNPQVFDAVVDECTDDLKSLFQHDATALRKIELFEEFVAGEYNRVVNTVEDFFERNKHLDVKRYVTLGKKNLASEYFHLAMLKFRGHEFCYKSFVKKQKKHMDLDAVIQQ